MAHVGQVFESREALSASGVHAPPRDAVSGDDSAGVFSLVLSAQHCHVDKGDCVEWTEQIRDKAVSEAEGSSGNILAGPRLWLTISCRRGQVIRLVRASGCSEHGPHKGYRYEGLFRVSRHWEMEILPGAAVHCFRLNMATRAHIEQGKYRARRTDSAMADVSKRVQLSAQNSDCIDPATWMRRTMRASTTRRQVPANVKPSNGFSRRSHFWSVDGTPGWCYSTTTQPRPGTIQDDAGTTTDRGRNGLGRNLTTCAGDTGSRSPGLLGPFSQEADTDLSDLYSSSTIKTLPLLSLQVATEQMRALSAPPKYEQISHHLYCHLCGEERDPWKQDSTHPMIRCARCRFVYCKRCLRFLLSPRPSARGAASTLPAAFQTNSCSSASSTCAGNCTDCTQSSHPEVEQFLLDAPGRWACLRCTKRCSCILNQTLGQSSADSRHRLAGWPNWLERCPQLATDADDSAKPGAEMRDQSSRVLQGDSEGAETLAQGGSSLRQLLLKGHQRHSRVSCRAGARRQSRLRQVSIAETLERLRVRCPAALQSEIDWCALGHPEERGDAWHHQQGDGITGIVSDSGSKGCGRDAPALAQKSRRKSNEPRHLSEAKVRKENHLELSPVKLPAISLGVRLASLAPVQCASPHAAPRSNHLEDSEDPDLSSSVLERDRPLGPQLSSIFENLATLLDVLKGHAPGFSEQPEQTIKRCLRLL